MPKSSDNPYRIFIRFKLEKIVTALYLVSNLLPGDEPLRLSLRSSGLNLLKVVNRGGALTKPLFAKMKEDLLYLRSLIGVGRTAGIISDMNAAIIDKEIEDLLLSSPDFLGEEEISEKFFYIPKPAFGIPGKFFPPDAARAGVSSLYFKKSSRSRAPRNTLGDNGDRKNMILRFVRERGEVSIADLRSEIKDFSEKTITRDLQALSDEGLIRKDGSRRWTRYRIP